jgi:hypothetical protein
MNENWIHTCRENDVSCPFLPSKRLIKSWGNISSNDFWFKNQIGRLHEVKEYISIAYVVMEPWSW